MTRVLTPVAIAIALLGSFGIAGCDGEAAGDRGAGDTTAIDTSGVRADSGIGGTEVTAVEREYQFEGRATSVSGDTVTIEHEEIGEYRPAGSSSFKLAGAEMAQYVETGERMHYTLKVTGDQAIITGMETAEEEERDGSLDAIRRDTSGRK